MGICTVCPSYKCAVSRLFLEFIFNKSILESGVAPRSGERGSLPAGSDHREIFEYGCLV